MSWKTDLEENAILAIEDVVVKEGNFETYEISVSPASKKGDNYLGIVYRIAVTGKKQDEEATSEWSFILKCCPSFIRKMPVDLYYKKEKFAYTEMLPHFREMDKKHGVPKDEWFSFTRCLRADMTPMKEFLIFDDLRREGFVMGSHKESLTRDQMTLLIESLAKVHSFSFAMKKREPERFDEFEARAFIENEFKDEFACMIVGSCKSAVEAMDDDETRRRLADFTADAWDKLKYYMAPESSRPHNLLVHGDCWTNNVMFRFEDAKPVEVRLLDWQVVRCISPVIDLAYLMFCSTDEALRGEHYESLLDLYHERLALCLERLGCDVDECYPAAAFRRHVADFMPAGLLLAIMSAPVFMCDEEDVPDMDEMMKKDTFTEEDFRPRGAGTQARYRDRIRGVVADFVKFGFL